ncbi:hypothetical protein ACF1BS_14700 [Streptomyces sp. NPDC014748]|uniref:hypothetical protein n=1 Tax=Streptomyces sp. NPDC014748 TaxID=3364905 RepID=UPI0036FCC104
MTTYFNKRTGDSVDMPGRSARLDSLDNWEIAEGTETPTVVTDGVLSRQAVPADTGAAAPQERESAPAAVPVDVPAGPPAKAAPKGEWQAYARARAQDSDEAAEIDGLTKDELISRYGGES